MPTTIQQTITAYQFNELSDKAKDKVREMFYQEIDLSDVQDAFREEMQALGIYVEDIQYSIARGQGDGASWTGNVNIIPFLERLAPDNPMFTKGSMLVELIRDRWVSHVVSVSRNAFFYNHSGTMRIDNIEHFKDQDHDTHPAVRIRIGILQGASVHELFESIGGEDFLEEVGTAILKEAQAHANDLYKRLLADYEWYIGDEHIAECAEINEWLFDENGKLVN